MRQYETRINRLAELVRRQGFSLADENIVLVFTTVDAAGNHVTTGEEWHLGVDSGPVLKGPPGQPVSVQKAGTVFLDEAARDV